MSTVFIGTSEFAAEVLGQLLDYGVPAPALAITRPPAPRGRGRHVEPTPVARRAGELGIPVLEPERLEDVAAQIASCEPEALLLCAYGLLVREPMLSDYEILNVHPSLLPRWRGAAPIERAIMAGDEQIGVSIMRLVAELDAGPVCARAGFALEPQDDYGVVSARLAAHGALALAQALRGSRSYAAQDDAAATYAEKITGADRLLDPALPAAELESRVRALHPHIGARLPDGLGVAKARIGDRDVEAGTLAAVDGRLYWGATPGSLELVRVKPAGGREMDAGSYLRGHAV